MPGLEWILPFTTVLVATVSCLITYRTARISSKTYKSQTQPKIIVYVHADEEREGMLLIRIRNIGHDIAEDITFTTDRPIPCPEEDRADMDNTPLLNGIKALAPGEGRDVIWGYFDELIKATNYVPTDISYQYRHEDEFMVGESCLEIKSFIGSPVGLKPFEKNVVKHLRGIEMTLKQTSTRLAPEKLGNTPRKEQP